MAKIVISELDIDVNALVKSTAEVKNAIDVIKKQQTELTKNGETASNQFVQNAADLKSLSTAYNANLKAISDSTNATAEQANRGELLNLVLQQEVTSIKEAREQNSLLNKLRNEANATTAEGIEEIRLLNAQLDRNNEFIKENADAYLKQKINIGNYSDSIKDALGNLNPLNGGMAGFIQRSKEAGGTGALLKESLGQATTGMMGLVKASLAFIATPIGAVLAAIVLVFALVKNAMDRSEESTNKITKVFATFGGMVNKVLKWLEPLGEFLIDNIVLGFELAGLAAQKALDLISGGLEMLGFNEAAQGVKQFGNEMKGAIKDAQRLADAEAELEKQQRLSQKVQLDYQKQAEKLRQIRDDESLSISQRIAANNELGAVLKKQLDEELKIAQLALEVANLRIKAEGSTKETLDQQAEALTKISDIQERITGQESEQLANLNSLRKEAADKETERRQKAEEQAQKRIDTLIATQEQELELFREKERFSKNDLTLQQKFAEQEIAILNTKLKNKRLTQLEYDTERLTIENDLKQKEIDENEAEVQRLLEFENRKIALQNEIDLQKAVLDDEKATLKLTQDLEKQLTELATIEATETEKGELRKLILEKYENELNAIVENAALKRFQTETDFKNKEIEFERAKNTVKLDLAKQFGNALLSLLGNSIGAQVAAIGLEAIIEIAKIRIATASAQQINLANATATAPPPFNAPFIAAALAQNVGLQAGSQLQQQNIIASSAIKTFSAVAKFEQGGIQEVGGKRHSAGGTKFYGEDGTTFEAERGEGIGVLNRGAFASFMDFNNRFGSGGISTPTFMQGGGVITQAVSRNNLDVNQLARVTSEIIASMPPPIVTVEDINSGQNNYANVVNAANF